MQIRFFLLIILAFYVGTSIGQNKNKWWATGTLEEIKKKAKKGNKYILIDCYTAWCEPCKEMDIKTFNDSLMGVINAKFIPCKIDMEKGEGIKIGKRYKVGCYPTFLFLDANGEVIHRTSGYMNKSDFGACLNDVFSEKMSFSSIEKAYRLDKEANVSAYLKILKNSCLPYKKVLEEYFSFNKGDLLFQWDIIREYVDDFNSKEFQFFLANRETYKSYADKDVVKAENIVNDYIQGVLRGSITRCIENKELPESMIDSIHNVGKKLHFRNWRDYSDTMAFFDKLEKYQVENNWNKFVHLLNQYGDRYMIASHDFARVNSEINDRCYYIFLKSNDVNILAKALSWMKMLKENQKSKWQWFLNGDLTAPISSQMQAIDLSFESGTTDLKFVKKVIAMEAEYLAAAVDTYASLLYKLKRYQEAEKELKEAIKVMRRFKLDSKESESLLNKIRLALK